MSARAEDCERKSISFKEIYVCDCPLSRFRGVFFRKAFTDQHAVLLKGCSSVHGVGISKSLDVIFLDESYRVLAVSALNPFGLCAHRGAKHVLEIQIGNAEKLGINVSDCLDLHCVKRRLKADKTFSQIARIKKQSGASMVEFLLVAPLLVYFGTGIVQMGMAYHARNILDYATFEAARVGAVHQADTKKMKGELAYRLGPIFPGDGSTSGVRSAVTDAIVAVNDPLRTHIRIINPTSAAFEDFGVTDPDSGELVLPSTHLKHRASDIGARSQVTIQDANLLKIEITHGYELRLPWLDVKLPGVDFVLKELMTLANPSNAQYYVRGQIPLRAVATVRMQSDAKANHVAAATQGVARPETETLNSAEPVQTPDDNLEEEDNTEQANENVDIEDTQPQEECEGSHGLPVNLPIETISGEPEDGMCAFLPPETPVTEAPLPEQSQQQSSEQSSSVATSTC